MPSRMSVAKSSLTEREFAFTPADFADIAGRIYALAGIVIKENKQDMVYSRLARRLRHFNYDSFAQYRAFLDTPAGAEETQSLVNALTTNMTSLFREPHHFEHLQHKRLPELMTPGRATKLRIWCSAASTGEEPYSIAAVLAEAGLITTRDDVKVLCTDLDTGVLAKAEAGIYPRKGLEKVPREYHKHFKKHGDDDEIAPSDSLRRFLMFRQLNLLGNWPMKGPFDVIFCRNVLIYFDAPTRKAVVERMLHLLPPGGVLYLGHSESMPGNEIRVQSEGHTIFRKL